MGRYCRDVRKLALELLEGNIDSLGLGPSYMMQKLQDGIQTMAINCYPPCPRPNFILGLPPHTDFSCITILLQNCPGLQVMMRQTSDDDSSSSSWQTISHLQGSLRVHVGGHLEVLSNGRYKSPLHRAVLSKDATRIFISSLHALSMDDKMRTADALVADDRSPSRYKESTFQDFLHFIAKRDIADGESFLETLKI